MGKRITISGYYGFGNIGDEAVLAGIRATIKEMGLDVEVTVLSTDPERTMREHPGVSAVHRYSLRSVTRAIRTADLFVSGGGSLLQDATSVRSSYYYLSVIKLAQFLKRRTMIYAQGIGPLNRVNIRKAVARALNHVDAITVRDEDSGKLLERIGVKREVVVSADPSFMVEPDLQKADALLDEAGLAGKELIGVALRLWPGYENWIAEAAATIAQACDEIGVRAFFIPMQEPDDASISDGIEGAAVLRHGGDVRTAKGLIARCSLVVGMRLHALIFAAGAEVPFVPVVYDPKVSSFAAEAQQEPGVTLGSEDPNILANAIRHAWEEREAARHKLISRAAALRELALKSGRLLEELLN